MSVDGAHGEDELIGNRPVGASCGQQPQHLELTATQPRRRSRLATAGPYVRGRGQRRQGAEPFEGAASRRQIERRSVLIAKRETGLGDDDTRSRLVVGGTQLAPRRHRLTQHAQCPARGLFEQQHQPAGKRRVGDERCGTVDRRDLAELVDAPPRRDAVSRSHHHLDVGGEQLAPSRRLARLVDRPADRGDRDVDPTLRQAQQRQPGLRITAPFACLSVEVLRCAGLAP